MHHVLHAVAHVAVSLGFLIVAIAALMVLAGEIADARAQMRARRAEQDRRDMLMHALWSEHSGWEDRR